MPKTITAEKSNSESNPTMNTIKPLTKIKIKSLPCTPAFECKSGELLWGQLQHMIKGSKETSRDTSGGPVSTGFGGTILQSTFRYRLAARKGNWIVERFESEGEFGCGFVVHHEDVSGQELLDRCSKVGISNGQGHSDHSIVYVNRYDWSFHSGDNDEVSKEVKNFIPTSKQKKKKSDDEEEDLSCDDNEFLDEIGNNFSARLIMLDATEYQSYMKLVGYNNHPEIGDNVQFKSSTGTICGVHLSDSGTEYELGWLVFSGEKHKDFQTDDEFIGLVYDSSYCGLEEGPFKIV